MLFLLDEYRPGPAVDAAVANASGNVLSSFSVDTAGWGVSPLVAARGLVVVAALAAAADLAAAAAELIWVSFSTDRK